MKQLGIILILPLAVIVESINVLLFTDDYVYTKELIDKL